MKEKSLVHKILILLGTLACASIIGVLFKNRGFGNTNVVSLYIFAVLLVARFTDGYTFGLLATLGSAALFNLLFTEPYYTFKINNISDIFAFFIMLTISIMTGALTANVRQATKEAKSREAENKSLYELTNHLTDAENVFDIGLYSLQAVYNSLSCEAGWINFNKEGHLEGKVLQIRENGSLLHRDLTEEQKNKDLFHQIKDLEKDYYEGEAGCDFPVGNRGTLFALLRLPKEVVLEMNPSQKRMVQGIIESSALAIDRFYSIQEQAKIKEESQRERYRANLLRAISHDLRTPLSGIMGTSEMLMSMTDKEDPRYGLARGIFKDADWLHSLVENILSLTKLQRENMQLQKKPEVVEEVVGVSLSLLEKRFKDREISIALPEEALLVWMDASLISQVLVNLLDNAIKHTKKGEEILLKVWEDREQNRVYFSVRDRGQGIEEKDLPYIFQSFYTKEPKADSKARKGIGLGLSICQSVVEAHGGKIYGKNREGGGAEFTFYLPMESKGDGDDRSEGKNPDC